RMECGRPWDFLVGLEQQKECEQLQPINENGSHYKICCRGAAMEVFVASLPVRPRKARLGAGLRGIARKKYVAAMQQVEPFRRACPWHQRGRAGWVAE